MGYYMQDMPGDAPARLAERSVPAYWIVKGCIRDPMRLSLYNDSATEILDSFGAEIIARSVRECPEKGCPIEIRAIVRFASLTEAQGCLDSRRLRSISDLYADVCEWSVVIVAGIGRDF